MTAENCGEHMFLAMWDCNGLEYLGDVTLQEQDKVWSALKGTTPTHTIPNFMHMKLRAQANTARHYEIYVFNAAPGICTNDIQGMFDANPQMAADTIRRVGQCLHSDRAEHEVAIR